MVMWGFCLLWLVFLLFEVLLVECEMGNLSGVTEGPGKMFSHVDFCILVKSFVADVIMAFSS